MGSWLIHEENKFAGDLMKISDGIKTHKQSRKTPSNFHENGTKELGSWWFSEIVRSLGAEIKQISCRFPAGCWQKGTCQKPARNLLETSMKTASHKMLSCWIGLKHLRCVFVNYSSPFWWCRFDIVFTQVLWRFWCRLLTNKNISETRKKPAGNLRENNIKTTSPIWWCRFDDQIVFLRSLVLNLAFLVMSFSRRFPADFMQVVDRPEHVRTCKRPAQNLRENDITKKCSSWWFFSLLSHMSLETCRNLRCFVVSRSIRDQTCVVRKLRKNDII